MAQWAAGMAAVCWVVQRQRRVSSGYGWVVGALVAPLAFFAWGAAGADEPLLLLSAGLSIVGVFVSMLQHRSAPERARRHQAFFTALAGVSGLLAVTAMGIRDADPAWLGALRALSGAAALGAVTDAMVLGHWYLVEPKLPKRIIRRLSVVAGATLLVDMGAMGLPPVSVFSAFSDGDSLTAAAWIMCSFFAVFLIFLTVKALDTPGYASVMAATGLSYVATMVAFASVVASRLAIA